MTGGSLGMRLTVSGVAKLGHIGARALATRGCAPPLQVRRQIIGADGKFVDRKLSAEKCIKLLSNRAVQYGYLYLQNNDTFCVPQISLYTNLP